MKKLSVKMLAEGGVLLALAIVLHLIKIYQAPYGGAVTAGSMVPIVLFAVRWGGMPGILLGTVFGLLQLLVDPSPFAGITVVSIILSLLLDYIVAFGFLGFAGIFRKNAVGIFSGITLGIVGRFIAHLISGVVIWKSFAPAGMNPWWYSFLYNGAYLLPELAITLLIIGLLYKPLRKYIIAQ